MAHLATVRAEQLCAEREITSSLDTVAIAAANKAERDHRAPKVEDTVQSKGCLFTILQLSRVRRVFSRVHSVN